MLLRSSFSSRVSFASLSAMSVDGVGASCGEDGVRAGRN